MAKLTEKEKLSHKRYIREIIPLTVIYMVAISGSVYFLQDLKESIWAFPLALGPLIPIYYIIRSVVNFAKRSDELMRKIYGESAVITLLVVMFSGFTYGLLMNVGLPQPDIFITASIICPIYFIVFAILRRRYGLEGCGIC